MTFKIPIIKRTRAPNKPKNPPIEQTSPSKTIKSSSTQTKFTFKTGKGFEPIDPSKHVELFNAYQDTPAPLYPENLTKVFKEDFTAEASQKELNVIVDYVITKIGTTWKK